MFGLQLHSISLFALLLSPAAMANSHHGRSKRRHEALVQKDTLDVEESGGNATHSLSKRAFQGRGTFYYTGLGACGQYSKDSDYMVALNSAQYGGGYPGPQCFKYITIQANGVTVGGVQILDECPTCDFGGLDLSPGLFTRFADAGAGVISLTWWFDGDGPAQPSTTSQYVAPSPTWSPDPAPSSTSTWSPPPTPSSTYVAPSSTSTYVAPSPSTTSSTSTSIASSFSSVVSSASASASNTTNPFAVVSNSNATSTSIDPSASAAPSGTSNSVTGSGSSVDSNEQGNLAAINGLVAQYGQLIVVGAGGHP